MKLRLTVDVKYETDEDRDQLIKYLERIADEVFLDGQITRDSENEVKEWSKTVEDPELSDMKAAVRAVGRIGFRANAYEHDRELLRDCSNVNHKLKTEIEKHTS